MTTDDTPDIGTLIGRTREIEAAFRTYFDQPMAADTLDALIAAVGRLRAELTRLDGVNERLDRVLASALADRDRLAAALAHLEALGSFSAARRADGGWAVNAPRRDLPDGFGAGLLAAVEDQMAKARGAVGNEPDSDREPTET